MKEFYQKWNPNKQSLYLLEHINVILDNYKSQGYQLTLRQLYYQLVSRGIIPNNTTEYSKLGSVVSKGRLAGMIDWYMIEDRGRTPFTRSHWDSPKEVLETAMKSYYRSRWEDQDYYVEVMSEKDAVSNIIQPVCRKWDVTFTANKGYSSLSALYETSLRMRNAMIDKRTIVIYLGDHDPSGIDMTRDITDRLYMFLEEDAPTVIRIALNMNQVQQYNPPENPAKTTDSRFKKYADQFGESSWELDALEPKVLETLVEDEITKVIDFEAWKEVEELEHEHKERLQEIADDFENNEPK